MPSDQRRGHIIDAARKIFVAQGFDGSRMRDIAAEAGINEALLYRHFASKDALFEVAVVAPLQDAVADLTKAASEPPASAESSLDEMRERTHSFLADLARVMQDVAPLLGLVLFTGEDSAAHHFHLYVAPVLEQVADVIRHNLGWWDHRSFDPDAIVRFLFGALWFEVIASRLGARVGDVDAVVDELTDTIIFGLAARD